MTKSLSQQIADDISNDNAPSFAQNRAQFLTNRSEIIGALKDGWSRMVIWKKLHQMGKVTFGYKTFTRLARQLIEPPEAAKRPPLLEATQQPMTNTHSTQLPATVDKPPGFTFNPVADPKKLF